MIRRLWTIAWSTSLLLFVCIAALWIKSYLQPDYLTWSRIADHHAESTSGKLAHWRQVHRFYRGRDIVGYGPTMRDIDADPPVPLYPRWPQWTNTRTRNWMFWQRKSWLGFSYETYDHMGGLGTDSLWSRLIIPYWMLAVVTGTLPTLRAVGWVRQRSRRRPGHCPECGYDLRASTDRCPECGPKIGDP